MDAVRGCVRRRGGRGRSRGRGQAIGGEAIRRWRCLPRRGDDAGGKYLISIPNPNIGSVQVDTHLVPSRATWPRRPRRDGQPRDFTTFLFFSPRWRARPRFLPARAPWVLLPSLIILRCIEADNVIVLWCCGCLVWLFEPAGFGARSIQCDGMLYDDDDEERRGEERAPKAYTRVLSIASFNSGESRRCLLPFPSPVYNTGTGPAGPGGWTRRLRAARAGAPGFHGGAAAVKHARRPSAFRLDMAALLSRMHGGTPPARAAAPRIRRSRNFAFKSTGPNSERLLVLSQSRSPARVRKQTKYRLSSDTHTAYTGAYRND
jgi:hypothetical protein